jgi:hypothetical protein
MSINDKHHQHKDLRSCVFCGLKNLFTHYAFSEENCLLPEEIRKTLSHAYEPTSQFQMNQMDDAAEVFVSYFVNHT